MAKSDLLKEAIADARAVKETAVANAKIALQEAFAPRIQRMISDQIENELDSEEGMPAEEPAMDDMGDMGAEEEGGDFNWVDNDLSAEVGGDTYEFEVGMAGEEDAMEPEMGAEELPMDEPQSDEEMADEYNEGYDERELDLESIIRELEGDMEPEMDSMDDMESEEDITTEASYRKRKPMDLEESDDMNIDEIIESILREEGMDESEHESDTTELDEAKEELEEAYKTVRQLKSIINEVNLLNAKLLYTNKLFRNFELSEGQKMKVIENFDRAANTREVKLVFSTLAESFNRPTTKRVVKESYASKPTATTAPKKTNVITEGFAQAERWKKLAGLL
jgi:hypothetical protein